MLLVRMKAERMYGLEPVKQGALRRAGQTQGLSSPPLAWFMAGAPPFCHPTCGKMLADDLSLDVADS